MGTLTEYKKYWDKKAVRDKMAGEKLRLEAERISERLKEILVREFRVKKVVLFGSVLCRGCFKEDSDIDIAVEGLPRHMYFAAAARLMMESPFFVDLKPTEDVTYLLKQRIAKGRILYEKRDDS